MLNTLLLHLATCVLVIAQSDGPLDPQNHFVYPGLPGPAYSDDPTVFALNQNFTVGEDQSQPFKWITNMTSTRITLWQEGNPDKVQQHIIYECAPSSDNQFYWNGDIGPIDLKNGSQAFLAAFDCYNPYTPVFYSHYINLTEALVVSSSSSTSMTSTSSSSTSRSTSLAATTTSALPVIESSTSTSPPSDNSSNAAALGGGIGGGIGGALLLIAAGFGIWKYRSSRKPADEIQRPGWSDNGAYAVSMDQSHGPSWYKPTSPMPAQSQPQAEYPPHIQSRTVSEQRLYEMDAERREGAA
ncbi:hypothetical protein F4821DRAFT_256292 [Hypoxylon rubiginosum]|uniref:Uncharacterized protein n=1 Tax=Hypoxylon rubiginosum TaxID=110542 RepID=A0ACC0DC46_9PEZI|nr:hypothetical protein F4821DRAFT_256292 [Hypoxylon rubiginosum]